VEPISVNYRSYQVWELPPNGQGLVALMALNILVGGEFSEKECLDTYHWQIEAIKSAFAHGRKYIGDPKSMTVNISDLLTEEYAWARREEIGKGRGPTPSDRRTFVRRHGLFSHRR